MSARRIRRFAFGIAAVIAVAALLPPFINANRFRARIAQTISLSLGRPVQMGDVHFRLVPQPGFVLSNLSIGDDPAFSAEPVLRSESVTASLRLTSLWRGRMEISSLSFEYPSLNLVRAPDGRWNVESILEQASQVPAAPTGELRPQSRPRFPYIEASNGRINFRVGQEKRPHVLMDADFSFWLEAEDQWNTRLEARPTRTDANLSDTGTVKAEGWLRRGDTLASTRMLFDISIERAQLGQWTSLLSGRDRGWRGDVQTQAHVEGTVSEFAFTARTTVRDFHRHDVPSRDSLEGRFDCRGNVSARPTAAPQASLACDSQLSGGSLSVMGELSLQRSPDYDLKVAAHDVPMSSMLGLYRRIKRDVPDDLSAEGTFTGEYEFTGQQGRLQVATGSGRVAGLVVGSEARGTSVAFTDFLVAFPVSRKKVPGPPVLLVGPAGTRLSGSAPVYVSAKIGARELHVEAQGDAALSEMVSAASLFGLADARYRPSGFAGFNLALNGTFSDFQSPVLTGSALLRDVSTQVDGVAAPLLIHSASLQLLPRMVVLQKLSARLEGTGTTAEGSISIPRECPDDECLSTFDLKASRLSLEELNRVLNPRYRSTEWLTLPLRFFEGKPVKTSRVMTLRADGRISVGRLVVKDLVATRVSGRLVFDQGKVAVTGLKADLLTGRHDGSWRADLTGKEPVFHGSGTVENLPFAQLNSLLRSPQGSGVVRLSYDLSMRGDDAAQLRQSSAGSADFRWRNGSWKNAVGTPLQFSDWSGKLGISDQEIELAPSLMQTRGGAYRVSGRVGFDRTLSLHLERPGEELLLTGTLHETRLVPPSTEQVAQGDSASNLKNASSAKVKN